MLACLFVAFVYLCRYLYVCLGVSVCVFIFVNGDGQVMPGMSLNNCENIQISLHTLFIDSTNFILSTLNFFINVSSLIKLTGVLCLFLEILKRAMVLETISIMYYLLFTSGVLAVKHHNMWSVVDHVIINMIHIQHNSLIIFIYFALISRFEYSELRREVMHMMKQLKNLTILALFDFPLLISVKYSESYILHTIFWLSYLIWNY